jgi:type II secretory pathway pseudopilin PulG
MRHTKSIKGFTIAELLIAIVVTLILVGILFRVFAAAASQWQTADQRIDTFRDARAALQIISRDLSRADVNGNSQMITLSDLFTVAPNPQFSKEAYAITPITNTGKSDLCTVGYYCSYDATTKAYSLKRLFKGSDATYTSLATATPNFVTIFQKDTPTADEIAAAYVWDLQFHPGVGKDYVDPATVASTQWNWLEVRFKSMSPASGRKIRNTTIDLSTWFDSASPLYKTFILPYEQQFVSRVVLQQNQ